MTWFLHFHKAGGSTVVALARRNGEALYHPNDNGSPLLSGRKFLRTWELSRDGLNEFVDTASGAGVTFLASEWGVPDLRVLAARSDVRVVTVFRDPIRRIVSNFMFDYRFGFSEAVSLPTWVDHPVKTHTFSNYYTRMLAGDAWRADAAGDEMVATAWDTLSLVDNVVLMDQPNWVGDLCQQLGWQASDAHENKSDLSPRAKLRLRGRYLRRGRVDLLARTLRQARPDQAEVAALADANALDIQLYQRFRDAIRISGGPRVLVGQQAAGRA